MFLENVRWPQANTPRGLLVRTTLLVILSLVIWRTALYQASLSLLRAAVEAPLTFLTSYQSRPPLRLDEKGDWNFSIPVNADIKSLKDGSASRALDAVQFAASPDLMAPFTSAWFVYVALALSLGISRGNLIRTFWGFLIQSAISALSLYAYLQINAQGILESLLVNPNALWSWFLKYAYHIDYLVVPYASPFLLLLLTHPKWWGQLASSTHEPVTPPVKIRTSVPAAARN